MPMDNKLDEEEEEEKRSEMASTSFQANEGSRIIMHLNET